MANNGSQRSATIKMVAERAGVGTTSVSRVLSNHPDVTEKMREKVLKAAQDVGYEIDLVARALRSGRSHTVGILLGDLLNPFLAEIASGAAERLHAAGYAVLLATSSGHISQDVESIRTLLQRRVDGLILSPIDETDPELHKILGSTNRPVMLLDRELPVPGLGAVCTEHRKGMDQVVAHLTEQGHTRIGLILGSRGTRPMRERLSGFQEAMHRRGVAVEDDLILAGIQSESFGAAASRQLLTSGAPPTAMICGGNQIIAGVLQTIDELDLEVPRDVSLVGCDDVSLTRLFRPHITVLARDAYALGEAAASGLIDRLDRGAEPSTITIGTELIIRESTRTLPEIG